MNLKWPDSRATRSRAAIIHRPCITTSKNGISTLYAIKYKFPTLKIAEVEKVMYTTVMLEEKRQLRGLLKARGLC
jgi:hypothetical protein